MRYLNNMRLKDKINTDTLVTQVGMLSVNRMNAQIKLMDIWKALNNDNCPLNVVKPMNGSEARSARSITNNMLTIKGRSIRAENKIEAKKK